MKHCLGRVMAFTAADKWRLGCGPGPADGLRPGRDAYQVLLRQANSVQAQRRSTVVDSRGRRLMLRSRSKFDRVLAGYMNPID